MSAKFVKNDNSCLCNICAETIVSDNAIGLKCNPTKHIFCYECILDWYKELIKNKHSNNYTIKNMCPICRKTGGLLPVHAKFKNIKGIHDIKEENTSVIIKTTKSSITDINPNKLPNKCGAKLKTKTGYCEFIGKPIYGGFCGRHSNCKVQQPIILTAENITETIMENIAKNIMENVTQDNTLIV